MARGVSVEVIIVVISYWVIADLPCVYPNVDSIFIIPVICIRCVANVGCILGNKCVHHNHAFMSSIMFCCVYHHCLWCMECTLPGWYCPHISPQRCGAWSAPYPARRQLYINHIQLLFINRRVRFTHQMRSSQSAIYAIRHVLLRIPSLFVVHGMHPTWLTPLISMVILPLI